MEENEIASVCERCGKKIHTGSAYVCLTRNIEQVEHSIANCEDEVVIIHSDMLLTLCGSCGNALDTETLLKLIQLTPGGKIQN